MQQTMQAQQLRRMAERSAVAFLLAVLCVYPLYIDKFSNLGIVKFTGVATLSWALSLIHISNLLFIGEFRRKTKPASERGGESWFCKGYFTFNIGGSPMANGKCEIYGNTA